MTPTEHPIRRRPDGTIDTDHHVAVGEALRAAEMNLSFFMMLKVLSRALTAPANRQPGSSCESGGTR